MTCGNTSLDKRSRSKLRVSYHIVKKLLFLVRMFCEFPELWRCCFCLPLRRGVLTFGYLNAIFSMFMIGVYSYGIHVGKANPDFVFHGTVTETSGEICIVTYLLEILFNIVLLYGAHVRHVLSLKIFYYYAILTAVASLLMQILYLSLSKYAMYVDLELYALVFAGLCLELYVIILVRTLIKKLSTDGPHLFENQLQQIVTGERKVETNVNNSSTTVTNGVENNFSID